MTRAILAALVGIALVGCGGSGAKQEEELSSFKVSLIGDPFEGQSFDGNSVWICGQRGTPADSKYPCLNNFCECFDFNADGTLRGEVVDLCPSKNVPEDNWDFQYVIYSAPGCAWGTGEVLNDNQHNFVCYDQKDFLGFHFENQTVDEVLDPGCNENEITCITRNAKKTFDFDVCVLVEPSCLPDANGDFNVACPPPPTCDYDGVCDPGESCALCPYHDNCCPPPPTCDYDGVCDPGETCALCQYHDNCCAPVCGDDICSPTEDCFNCPLDCGGEGCFELDCGCRAPEVWPDSINGGGDELECVCPDTVEAPEACRLETVEEGCKVLCRGTPPAIDQDVVR